MTDKNYRPGRDYLTNEEVEATGLLIGGAVANICRELLALREANRWIPVSERLPDERALAFTPTQEETVRYRIAPAGLSRTMIDATHWRPLPAAPEGK